VSINIGRWGGGASSARFGASKKTVCKQGELSIKKESWNSIDSGKLVAIFDDFAA
jgi:hypothetical protein